jgi:hypothetical protein
MRIQPQNCARQNVRYIQGDQHSGELHHQHSAARWHEEPGRFSLQISQVTAAQLLNNGGRGNWQDASVSQKRKNTPIADLTSIPCGFFENERRRDEGPFLKPSGVRAAHSTAAHDDRDTL